MRSNKKARFEDIKNRYNLAMAERNFYPKETKEYQILSKVIKMINAEIPKVCQAKSEKHVNRYGFRYYNGEYHIITLNDSDIY